MNLRKFSEHGLGHLLNPTSLDDESVGWIETIWVTIVRQALGFPVSLPEWFTRPAVGRETASKPTLLQRLTSRTRKPLPYADRIKPMNFLLTVHIAPCGYPQGVDPKGFRLIAPFQKDSSKWLRMPWTDIYSGRVYWITTEPDADSRLVRVKSYGEVFADYVTHPEPKSPQPPAGRHLWVNSYSVSYRNGSAHRNQDTALLVTFSMSIMRLGYGYFRRRRRRAGTSSTSVSK